MNVYFKKPNNSESFPADFYRFKNQYSLIVNQT